MLQGLPLDFSALMGFLKFELSRRIGQEYRLPGTLWHQRYAVTALPTHESQLTCLWYLIMQGVKEGLVAPAIDWAGLHCTKALLSNNTEIGGWFQASEYHQAKARNALRKPKRKYQKSPFIGNLRFIQSPPGSARLHRERPWLSASKRPGRRRTGARWC